MNLDRNAATPHSGGAVVDALHQRNFTRFSELLNWPCGASMTLDSVIFGADSIVG
jgi:hypothetical protein